ncbi:MAG: hypothetical protein HC842_01645 [Cytophagales bacterium]|nr:hypothetical protein [Cytophagales bacterium]
MWRSPKPSFPGAAEIGESPGGGAGAWSQAIGMTFLCRWKIAAFAGMNYVKSNPTANNFSAFFYINTLFSYINEIAIFVDVIFTIDRIKVYAEMN